MNYQRWTRWGLLAPVVAVAVSWWMFWPASERMPYRFSVVTPGKMYRSGQPDEQELENLIRKYGVRTVLALRDEGYAEQEAERRVAQDLGVKVIRIAIRSSKPFPPDVLAELRQVFDNKSRHPILAHCEHGRSRTGVVVALWRIEQDGWPGGRAVEEMIRRGYRPKEKTKPVREAFRDWTARTARHRAGRP